MADTTAEEREPLGAKPQKTTDSAFKRYYSVTLPLYLKHVTVEPAGAIFLTASILSMLTSQTLQLEKTCRVNLNLTDEICTSLRNQDSANNTRYEKEVQQYLSIRLALRSILQSILPCFVLMLVGAWSDKTGRRVLLIAVPMIGEIVQCINSIINVFFFYELPVEAILYSESIFLGILGGWPTLFLGMFSYIGDITTEENRTHRLGFVQFFTFIGLPIGLSLSGVILKKFGYYTVYVTSLTLHVINMLYVTCKIKDPERNEKQKKRQDSKHMENEPLNKPPPPIKKISTIKKYKMYLRTVTYEPVVLLYEACYIITIATSQNVMLEKACRVDLAFGDDICTALRLQNQSSKMRPYEEMLQKYVAPSVTLRTYTILGIPCTMLLLVGFFSDNTGYRKVVPMIQIAAQMLICANNLLQVAFIEATGLYAFVITEALMEGFGGGFVCLLMTAFSYMGKVTSVEERTFRIGLLYFCQTLAIPVGLSIVGPLLKHYGYYWCYSVSGCLNLVNFLYNWLWIVEAKRSAEQKQHDGRGFFYFLRIFFDFTNIRETVRVVFKIGPNNRRMRICILLGIVSILFGPMYGELAVLYMSTRYRFGWDELQFSVYQTYNFITHTVGTEELAASSHSASVLRFSEEMLPVSPTPCSLDSPTYLDILRTVFSLVVFSKLLKWHDSVLGLISTLSKIAGAFIYCFATTSKIFYLGPLVEILNGTSLLAMRSIMSKLVAPDELGKVNSIFGLTENLMPLIYVPLYTTVYTATMEVLPGAVFLMGACMTIPAVAVFLWLLYEHRKGVSRLKNEEKEVNGVTTPLNGTVEIPLQ